MVHKYIFINRYFYPDHSATSQLLSDLAFELGGQGWRIHVITSRQRDDDLGAGLAAAETVWAVKYIACGRAAKGRAGNPFLVYR